MAKRRVPSLNWLRVFEAAAREGSFAGAARLLNMTPPAVGKQIRALETDLGQPLFERRGDGVRLTATGKALLPGVRESLLGLEATFGSMFGPKPSSQAISIAMPHVLACSYMAEALPRFETARPDVRVHVRSDVPQDAPAAGVDLQIAFGPGPPGWGDADRLFGEALTPVAPPEVAAIIGGPPALAGRRLIEVGVHKAGWVEFLGRFAEVDLGALELTSVDSTAAALALSAAGGGVALARAPATDFLVEKLGLVACEGGEPLETTRAYYLVCPSRRKLRRAAAALREWLLADRISS